MRAVLFARATVAPWRGGRASQPGDPHPRHLMAATPMHGGAGTVDQQLAQIRVAALADPAEPLLAAARMLLWNQADPGGKVPPRSEESRIADGGRQRRSGNQPDTQKALSRC